MIDLKQIRLYALAASAAYGNPATALEADGWAVTLASFGGTDLAIVERGAQLLIAWAGTNDRGDWRQNAWFPRRRWPGVLEHGSVHGGFLEYTERGMPFVLAHVAAARAVWGEDLKVINIGHSLGGAAALLASLRLLAVHPVLPPVSFGSPRAVSLAASREIDRRLSGSIRLVSVDVAGDQDFVPHVPPRFLGNSHTGVTAVLGPGAKIIWGEAGWRELRGLWPNVILPSRAIRAIRQGSRAHPIDVYLRNLGGI